MIGKAMHVWRQEVYGISLYIPFNCSVNLKLLLKIVNNKKIPLSKANATMIERWGIKGERKGIRDNGDEEWKPNVREKLI